MKNKDTQLIWEAYNEAYERPPHNAYPPYWPLSKRGPDQLKAHKQLLRMGKKVPSMKYNPINPKNNQPFEGFWVNDTTWETIHDPTEPDGTLFKVERIGEWPNWKVTKISQS